MNQKKKEKQEWKPFFHLLKEAKLPWGWYVFNVICSLVLSTIYMSLPQVAGQIMAGEIFNRTLVITYIVVTVGIALVSLPFSLLAVWIQLRTDRNLRRVVWRRLIHLPMKEIDTMPPTSLVSRVTVDTATVSYAIEYIFSMFTTIYSLCMMLGIIGTINVKMLLMMGLLVPCIIIANIPSHYMHNAKNEMQEALAKYTNFLAERLGALRQIKVCASEEKEDIQNDAAAKNCFRAKVKLAKLDFLAQPLTYGMDAVVQAVILIYGGYLLSTGELNTENIVTLFMYATSLSSGAYQFVFCWQNIKQAQGASRTVGQIMDMKPEKLERSQSFAIPDAAIRFEDVSFSYQNGDQVLDHVNIDIPKGKVTAIVGPSGSGKTTVLKLLERLYQPVSGQILFGDKAAESIHLDEWRESFGMVPQNSPLLFGTIRDNITYGMEETVSEERLQKAMAAANVQEIIDRLPEGLDSDVGDVGSKMSGGEKQRIALARMMIRDPEYLLLDEATSSLDAQNENHVMSAIAELMKGRTCVVVAHNLRTVEHADHIVFMENGRVASTGNHETLYRENETYRRYVDLQRQNRSRIERME